ncbi:hypothetical protein AURDEDRAFT_177169 [Auricularia subglabra TFB-10046 SS5]|uniref:Uncharacterized protein n=1 Tax=Auricularia subglabra (strain TFB-10046 / SS5) TaxID=717982 RepID=J0LBC1_AURST|nr:hypothetical protein AURDEDRAFT_177169 [Auricularia subglabra TFB-10046 SS5]
MRGYLHEDLPALLPLLAIHELDNQTASSDHAARPVEALLCDASDAWVPLDHLLAIIHQWRLNSVRILDATAMDPPWTRFRCSAPLAIGLSSLSAPLVMQRLGCRMLRMSWSPREPSLPRLCPCCRTPRQQANKTHMCGTWTALRRQSKLSGLALYTKAERLLGERTKADDRDTSAKRAPGHAGGLHGGADAWAFLDQAFLSLVPAAARNPCTLQHQESSARRSTPLAISFAPLATKQPCVEASLPNVRRLASSACASQNFRSRRFDTSAFSHRQWTPSQPTSV